jgi:mono/diheme cytochrome c family protein
MFWLRRSMAKSVSKSVRALRWDGRLALVAWLLLGCDQAAPLREWTPADHGQPAAPPDDRTAPAAQDAPVSAEEADRRAAAALWNVSCASCHGRDGRGGGGGLPPGAKTPDLSARSYLASRGDAELEKVIRDGRNMMPAFGPQLGPDGVRAMVEHVWRLAGGREPAAK